MTSRTNHNNDLASYSSKQSHTLNLCAEISSLTPSIETDRTMVCLDCRISCDGCCPIHNINKQKDSTTNSSGLQNNNNKDQPRQHIGNNNTTNNNHRHRHNNNNNSNLPSFHSLFSNTSQQMPLTTEYSCDSDPEEVFESSHGLASPLIHQTPEQCRNTPTSSGQAQYYNYNYNNHNNNLNTWNNMKTNIANIYTVSISKYIRPIPKWIRGLYTTSTGAIFSWLLVVFLLFACLWLSFLAQNAMQYAQNLNHFLVVSQGTQSTVDFPSAPSLPALQNVVFGKVAHDDHVKPNFHLGHDERTLRAQIGHPGLPSSSSSSTLSPPSLSSSSSTQKWFTNDVLDFEFYSALAQRHRDLNQAFTHHTQLENVEFLHGGPIWDRYYQNTAVAYQNKLNDKVNVHNVDTLPQTAFDALYKTFPTTTPLKKINTLDNSNNDVYNDVTTDILPLQHNTVQQHQQVKILNNETNNFETFFTPILDAIRDAPKEYNLPFLTKIHHQRDVYRNALITTQHIHLQTQIAAFYDADDLTKIQTNVLHNDPRHINAFSLPQHNNSQSFPHLQPTPVFASYTEDFFDNKQEHLSLSHPDFLFPSPPIFLGAEHRHYNIAIQPLPPRKPRGVGPTGERRIIDPIVDYAEDYRYWMVRRIDRRTKSYSKYYKYKKQTTRINLQGICFSDFFPAAWLRDRGYGETDWVNLKDIPNYLELRRDWYGFPLNTTLDSIPRHPHLPASPLNVRLVNNKKTTNQNGNNNEQSDIILTSWEHRCVTPVLADEPEKEGVHSIRDQEWRLGKRSHLGTQDSRQFIDQCSRLMVLTSVFSHKAPYAPEHVNEVHDARASTDYGLLFSDYFDTMPHCEGFYKDYLTRQDVYDISAVGMKYVGNHEKNWQLLHHGVGTTFTLHPLILLQKALSTPHQQGIVFSSSQDEQRLPTHNGIYDPLNNVLSLHKPLYDRFFDDLRETAKVPKLLTTAPKSDITSTSSIQTESDGIITKGVSTQKQDYPFIWLPYLSGLRIYYNDARHIEQKINLIGKHKTRIAAATPSTHQPILTQPQLGANNNNNNNNNNTNNTQIPDTIYDEGEQNNDYEINYDEERNALQVEIQEYKSKNKQQQQSQKKTQQLNKKQHQKKVEDPFHYDKKLRKQSRQDRRADLPDDNDPLLWVIKHQNNQSMWDMGFVHNKKLLKTKPEFTTDISQLPLLTAPTRNNNSDATTSQLKTCYDLHFDDLQHLFPNPNVFNPTQRQRDGGGLHASGLPYLFRTQSGQFVYATLLNDLGFFKPLFMDHLYDRVHNQEERYYVQYIVFFDPMSMLVLGVTPIPLTQYLFKNCHLNDPYKHSRYVCPQLERDYHFVYLHHWFPNETPMTLTFHDASAASQQQSNDEQNGMVDTTTQVQQHKYKKTTAIHNIKDLINQQNHQQQTTKSNNKNNQNNNTTPTTTTASTTTNNNNININDNNNPKHLLDAMLYYPTSTQFFISLNIHDDFSMLQEINVEQAWQRRKRCDQFNFKPTLF